MGPTSKKKHEKEFEVGRGRTETACTQKMFLIFLFSNLLSQIYENLTAGIRRDKHEKCSTRRGLRVSTRNTRFHREFR